MHPAAIVRSWFCRPPTYNLREAPVAEEAETIEDRKAGRRLRSEGSPRSWLMPQHRALPPRTPCRSHRVRTRPGKYAPELCDVSSQRECITV